MPKDTPKTHEDAIQKGARTLTSEQAEAIPKHHIDAALSSVAPASGNAPGTYCTETPCLNGKKYVIYRDDTGGCTRYVEMDC
jgi:hypothetical protein